MISSLNAMCDAIVIQYDDGFAGCWTRSMLRGFFVIALLILFLLCEAGLRLSGIADMPLYDANQIIGYIPKASQAGTFPGGSQWQFNSKHMGAVEFAPTTGVDNLLIGDSIVFGGAPYGNEERLGPQLQRVLNEAVWPISAASWALRNELAYLRMHPEVVKNSDRIIFLLNSGDFGEASSWICDSLHPRSRPVLVSWYLLERYVFKDANCAEVQKNMKVAPGDWRGELKAFVSSEEVSQKQIFIFLYPNVFQAQDPNKLHNELELHISDLVYAGISDNLIFSVARYPEWQKKYYRDDVHPTVEGNRILASYIARQLTYTTLTSIK